jgi:AcrR family transcriptional regulator
LDLAAELFATHGYRSTSLELVAERLGVTRQALYYHFRNKGEILAALFEEMMTRLETAVAAAAHDADDPFLAMLYAHVETAVVNTNLVALLLHERPEIAKLDGVRAAKRRREHARLFVSAYEEGARAGRFRSVDPTVAVNTLISAANGISWWYHGESVVMPEIIVEAVFKLLTAGFLARPAEAAKVVRFAESRQRDGRLTEATYGS